MVMKTLAMGTAIALLVTAPVTVPLWSGAPVSLTAGPVAVTLHKERGIEFELDQDCILDTCPIVGLRIGDRG